MTEHASVCTLDCPDTCSLTVTVQDEHIVAIRGSHANPYTDGVTCAKVPAMYPGFVHGERRIRTPLRRLGPRGGSAFEPISWDAALDIIHERFAAIIAAHGPQAILPLSYAGPHGSLAVGSEQSVVAERADDPDGADHDAHRRAKDSVANRGL